MEQIVIRSTQLQCTNSTSHLVIDSIDIELEPHQMEELEDPESKLQATRYVIAVSLAVEQALLFSELSPRATSHKYHISNPFLTPTSIQLIHTIQN